MVSELEPRGERQGAPHSDAQLSRRRLIVLGAAALPLLAASACTTEPASCQDVSSLKPEDAQMRTNMEYVDRAPQADKTCEKCLQYVAPPSRDVCGSCRVLKGPVHPSGTCKLFAAK